MFEFLLEREPKEAILPRFELPVIERYFPEYARTLTVPSEFLESGTQYELEVLALELSGNQTITLSFFETH